MVRRYPLLRIFRTIHRSPLLLRAMRVYRRIELPLLAVILLSIFCNAMLVIPFHPDESQWIATSNVFEPFVKGDRRAAVWDESLWTLTQPPGTRYIIGAGRLAGGYGENELNTPWAFGRDRAGNIAAGALPQPDLLWWSRLPMALLGSASCLLSFYLLKTTANRLAAYCCLLLTAFNPFILTTLRRAMAEAPLLFSLLLITYFGTRLINTAAARDSLKSVYKPLVWLLLMAAATAIAGSIKLSGLTAIVGVLMVWVAAISAPINRLPSRAQWLMLGTGSVLAVVTTIVIFVGLNPYLDADPLGRTAKLITFRATEMQKQMDALPAAVIDSLAERIALTYTYLFQYTALMRFPGAGIINAVLWIIGASQLVVKAWQSLRHAARFDANSVLLVMAATCAGPMLSTPLNWDRYFLLPIWFSILLIAVGAAWVLRSGYRIVAQFIDAQPRSALHSVEAE